MLSRPVLRLFEGVDFWRANQAIHPLRDHLPPAAGATGASQCGSRYFCAPAGGGPAPVASFLFREGGLFRGAWRLVLLDPGARYAPAGEASAARGAKLQLELGGKNPAIVLADADMDHALMHVINGAMMSTGQKCTATSRALVDRKIADEFTEKLASRVASIRVGDPLDPDSTMGPLIDDRAADRVAGEVERAKAEGVEHLFGGERLSGEEREKGAFVAPAIFANVKPDSRLGQEELFGPVLGVMPIDGLDEAIDIANKVRFGLSASIFTRDLATALNFAQGIEAGIVHVNSETAGAEPQVPFGGMKGSSSYSREQGKSAREFFTQVKTVYIDLPPA